MKSSGIRKTVMIVSSAILLLQGVVAPGRLQAATAQVRTCAEVVAPVQVDSSRLLAGAGSEQAEKTTAGSAGVQAEPVVKLTFAEGATWLTVDFN